MYVSDFALFSRLFLISELKCCSCVVFRFFHVHKQKAFVCICFRDCFVNKCSRFSFCVCVDCN